jgi:hypothetical protein
VTRVANALAMGTHKKILSKFVATEIVGYIDADRSDAGRDTALYYNKKSISVDIPDKEFDKDTPTLLTQGFSEGAFAVFTKAYESANDAMKSKMITLDQYMKEKEWVGAVGHVVGAKCPDISALFECTHVGEVGAEAWLMACSHRARRSDPTCIPLVGIASMFFAVDASFVVHLTPLSVLLSGGIAYADMESFFESPGGQTFMKSHMLVVVVPKDARLFIPAGYAWGVVHLELDDLVSVLTDSEDTSKTKSVLMTDSIGHACVHPLFVKEWHEAMDDSVFNAVRSLNTTTFDAKKSKSMWKERADTFKKAFKPASE